MIRSMTGFGAASDEVGGAHFAVEIRSVNNRFFKCLVRVPEELQGIEPELESAVAAHLSRGSVVATVRFADASADAAARINAAALARYVEQLRNMPGLGDAGRIDLAPLLALPGVVIVDGAHVRLDRARPVLLRLVEDACAKVIAMRRREGATLHEDLHRHCEVLAAHLAVITERAPQVIEAFQARLRQRMDALLAEVGTSARDEDVLREVAVFSERSDIAEEISRLRGHIDQFIEIIDRDEDGPVGRTLDFISQEMLREANTIGSKCLDVEVSRRIVEIKGGIDRLKEQAQNVE